MTFYTLREQVHLKIKEKIMNGELKPGDKIIESNLAADFNVSRGPIREALRKLELEGLVAYEANKGCTVRIIEETEIQEVYVVRSALERLAIDLCKGKFSAETIKRMSDIVEEMGLKPSIDSLSRLIELDEEFHSNIIREGNNDKLYQTWSSFKNINIAIFSASYLIHSVDRKKQQIAHQRILSAIETADSDTIKEAVEKHYIRSSQLLD